ncbi:MAG TPA: acyltransferase, partial [Bacteroidales bacterium]|nr:acyltransferase [Bacteroidales bacterium]
MTRRITAALVQENWAGTPQTQHDKLASRIREAAQAGANLVILQELHDGPYFCQTEDVALFNLAVRLPGPASDHYASLARENNVVLVTSLFERRAAGLYHNTALVFDTDGSLAGRYRKMHIPDDPA